MNKRDLKKSICFLIITSTLKQISFLLMNHLFFSQHFDDVLISLFAEIANSNQQTQAKHCS